MAGSMILDSRGNPITIDSVSSAIQQASVGASGFAQPQGFMARMFAPQLAAAAYLASGMLQKVIDIPASDRVREWRDWQAEKDQIEAIEAEEKRLGLLAKVRHAEVLRGLGGGALLIITAGNHDQPLTPDTVRAQGIVAINVVSRSHITGEDYDTNLASPTYGAPKMWRLNGQTGDQARIHPSRVICFRGDPRPSEAGGSNEDAFWGQSRLLRVWQEVQRSDSAQDWFAALVRKAKLLRIGIPGLTDFTATDKGQERLNRRMSAIALSESVLNATVYDSGSGEKGAGENISDYQVTWAGIPAMMDAFDQRVAAVADIPFTRLMGRSPAGMNSTGSYDDQNWAKAVSAGQQLETRPCLEALDPILLRSAGVDPAGIWWKWAPLWAPTEKETADTFKVEMDAITALQATGSIPEIAFNKGVQNLMSEREYLPGLDQALSEVAEAERFGISPEVDPADPSDPSEITQQQREEVIPSADDPAGVGSAGRRRAANDKVPEADA